MSGDRLGDWRTVQVSEPLFPQFQGSSEPAHQRSVGVAESMETVSLWNLDFQLLKQWPELPLEEHVLVPWRTVARGEQEPLLIRTPGLEKRLQVFACLRRQLDHPRRLLGFWIAKFPPPGTLPHLKQTLIEVQIVYRETA